MAVGGLELELAAGAVVGLGAGGWLLVRGLLAWRDIEAVDDIGTSSVSSLAAGEARLAGTIQPLALTLRSPLQSMECLYYRSRVRQDEGRNERRTIFSAERAVGFTLTDGSGTIKVLPRGATWRVPPRLAGEQQPARRRPHRPRHRGRRDDGLGPHAGPAGGGAADGAAARIRRPTRPCWAAVAAARRRRSAA